MDNVEAVQLTWNMVLTSRKLLGYLQNRQMQWVVTEPPYREGCRILQVLCASMHGKTAGGMRAYTGVQPRVLLRGKMEGLILAPINWLVGLLLFSLQSTVVPGFPAQLLPGA